MEYALRLGELPRFVSEEVKDSRVKENLFKKSELRRYLSHGYRHSSTFYGMYVIT